MYCSLNLRGEVKYYFADFVRKGGGGTPQIRNSFFAKELSEKGGTSQLRNFLGKKVGVSGQKHNLEMFCGKKTQS